MVENLNFLYKALVILSLFRSSASKFSCKDGRHYMSRQLVYFIKSSICHKSHVHPKKFFIVKQKHEIKFQVICMHRKCSIASYATSTSRSRIEIIKLLSSCTISILNNTNERNEFVCNMDFYLYLSFLLIHFISKVCNNGMMMLLYSKYGVCLSANMKWSIQLVAFAPLESRCKRNEEELVIKLHFQLLDQFFPALSFLPSCRVFWTRKPFKL